MPCRQYYETAANLGDTGESSQVLGGGAGSFMIPNRHMKLTRLPRIDAMNEVAWCYLEGFGCKKDKVSIFPLSSSRRLL